MSIDFLLALAGGKAPATKPAPVVSGVTASDPGGIGCNGTTLVNDSASIAWSISNPNNALYYTNVLRNGLKRNAANLTNTTTSYSDTLHGSINAGGSGSNVSYTYTVEVRKIADNTLVSSASASTLALTLYNSCVGGGGHL